MRVRHWNTSADGPLSEAAMRRLTIATPSRITKYASPTSVFRSATRPCHTSRRRIDQSDPAVSGAHESTNAVVFARPFCQKKWGRS